MQSRCCSPWLRPLVAVLLVTLGSASLLQASPIHLRNAVINPLPLTAHAATATANANVAPASGLYLVQLADTPPADWRAQLAALGVDVLRYVPENTYIARVRAATPAQVQALGFVNAWLPYRPDFKLHRELTAALKSVRAGDAIAVSVLLAPRTPTNEVFQIRRLLQRVQQEADLRFGPILRGSVLPANLLALARSDAVLWIERGPRMKLRDEVASKIVAGDGGLHQTVAQSLGYDGTGVGVAVADSGLNNGDAATMHPDLAGRTPAFFAYGGLPDAADEHSHGTHVAGIIAGNGATGETDDNGALYGLGVAPGASIITQRIFDGVGNFFPPASFGVMTRDATRAGATIGSNSWGDDTQGRYDLSAQEFDELVRDGDPFKFDDQPYILEFSAGNAGPGAQTIGSPAVAKNVIATGASQNDRRDLYIYDQGPDAMADFSSRGPCEDGRIKPDVTAPGTWISSLKSASATDENAWAPIDDFYLYMGGTSQAGPHVSGAAAVFVQYYRDTHGGATPSPALVKAALINCAVPLNDPTVPLATPNMDEGWGRVDLTKILASPRGFDVVDQTELLTTGQVYERHIVVASPDEPLKVTLAYTDVPGLPAAVPALVNDLDLEVVGPDGTLYRGNQFTEGESTPNAATPDSINNVEGVFLSAPAPGEYLLRVRARKVVDDARIDTPGIDDQDFALVASALLLGAGQSAVVLDRHSYTAPGQIKIKLIDRDLAGISTATVTAISTTETTPETVMLSAANANGVFTGAIATATGPAIHDNQLQLQHGDSIQVVYHDVSAASNVTAVALADLLPPVLTNVSATNQFGEVIIAWDSDEPASSIVRYGTNLTLNLAATNAELTTSHSLALDGLLPGVLYHFVVISSDEAGNTATNNNGSTYTLTRPPPATVLLVDEYTDQIFSVPPLSGYTDPLNALGVTYDVWDATTGTTPTLTNLLAYRAVIWRLPEFYGDFTHITWSLGDERALADYLRAGGSVLVSSMEVLSRLDEAGTPSFRTNFLQVSAFNPDVGVAQLVGSTNDPIGGGINVPLDYTVYEDPLKDLLSPPLPADASDTFTPTLSAKPVFFTDTGAIAGLRYPRPGVDFPGRLVFLSFPLDAVPLTGTTNNRAQLLQNILGFLVPGVNGLGNLALDRAAYRFPDTVTVEVDDTSLAGQGTATATFTSTTQTNTVPVTLHETTRRGSFRGTLDLISATNAPTAGKLRVHDGDTLEAVFSDASAQRSLTTTAIVDLQPPVISGVASEPDYTSATISWTTSKPSDSQVQFGESLILNRTVADPELGTSHALVLSGLQPDTTYFFQVLSHDEAGNAAQDDNGGKLFTFTTPKPLAIPWSDNLDTGATNWTVYSSADAQVPWTLGVPNNGAETNAHSPPNAWGSNLNGSWIDYTETFLISPAVYLAGGNKITLRFWHSYNFTDRSSLDVINQGQVLLGLDNIASPVTLGTYSGDAVPWEPVEIDLSPYVGHVAYLVWAYQVLSFDAAPRPAWLVDDVSITTSNVVPGTIQITNNLWQARYLLTGPLNHTGSGMWDVISNAPPGDYRIEFVDVPFYDTPPPQTNKLASGVGVRFQGDYTFTDANHNGIPDAYELQYFGSVSTNRTRATDTDGDGQSDYAEFIAGTNPTNRNSVLRLTATQPTTNGPVQIEWPSRPYMGYRVHGSRDGLTWSPVTDWFQAVGYKVRYSLPPPTNGAPYLFRIEVQP